MFLTVAALLACERRCGRARAHFEHDTVGIAPREFHRLRETHGGAQVVAPVLRRNGLFILQPLSRHGADDRDAWRVQLHAFHDLLVRRHDRVHHRAVEGVAGHEQLAGDAFLLQLSLQFRDRLMWSTGHAELRTVVRGDAASGGQLLHHILFRRAHTEHAAAGQILHHAAAVGDELHGILQREYTGQACRSELTDAMAQHRVRRDAPMHPQLGEAVVHREQGGLCVDGLFQLFCGLLFFTGFREDDVAQ